MRALYLLYTLIAYLVFLGSFLYAIGFVGNFAVPKSIDSGATSPLLETLVVNLLALGAFAIQHTIMARPGFKRWWTRIVPAPIERATFVLIASLILFMIFAVWRPMPAVVWNIENEAARLVVHAICAIGWLVVLLSTFMINHFELFGWKQALARQGESGAPTLVTRYLYKFVRHPIMLGFIIAFWAAPTMTQGHLLFAFMTTSYIFIGVLFEERDLVKTFGASYRKYQRDVPMIVPTRVGRPDASGDNTRVTGARHGTAL